MRISDWSSDVCSSDLPRFAGRRSIARSTVVRRSISARLRGWETGRSSPPSPASEEVPLSSDTAPPAARTTSRDRKSVVEGKSVSVRVDLGGRRIMKKKKQKEIYVTNKYEQKQT